jgi:hypothetical protein
VGVAFLDEGDATPRVMEVTEALATAIARAAAVNLNKDAFAVSFSSLLIGLLGTPDGTGDWLRNQFAQTGADLDGLLRRRGLEREAFNTLLQGGPTVSIGSRPRKPVTRTASARQALGAAEQAARGAGDLTDTRHVLTSLMSLPGFHDSDFEALGIDRHGWMRAWTGGDRTVAPVAHEATFDPRRSGVEFHVALALTHANALAGTSPIGPEHVITAIVRLAEQIDSAAFKRFAQLVPLPAEYALPPAGSRPEAERFDPELLRNLTRAQSTTAADGTPGQVWGRDLATAALLCTDDRVGPIVVAAGQPLDLVRDLWYAFLTTGSRHRTAGEWAAWWRWANVPLPGPRRAGYATETDQGDDKLGVEGEAYAFARLILDRDVAAPLSIGLLGDWGSGKSFFIEQIKKAIAQLRAEQRPELYRRVVEIEFNAWHASDSNLWASLVTNIFDAIWENVTTTDKTRDPKAAQEQLQKQIEQARGAVHEAESQVQVGQQALETAERDLEQKRTMLAWNRYVKSFTSAQLQRLAKSAGWHESIQTINDVDKAVTALAASGNRLRMMVSALLERPIRRIALPTAVLIGGTLAFWLLVDVRYSDVLLARLTKALAVVASAVGALAWPLRTAKQSVDALSNGLQRIHTEYEGHLNALKTTGSAEAEAVTRARRELESTEASVATARAHLAELLNQQATMDPRRRLGAFLEERVRSTQYRSQQGIISLVHKDFSELSKYMKELRESAAASDAPSESDTSPGEKGAIRPFDRVVIYVDDLDRCRPAHVVNMLEAVHLLLALDLFVVVVAVDSRWLVRALQVHYQDLLTAADSSEGDGLRSSTPQSYLEKIFQITYALGPMNATYFRDYVAFLAGEDNQQKRDSTDGSTSRQPAGGERESAGQSGGGQRQVHAGTGTSDDVATRTVQTTRETAQGAEKTARRPSPAVHISQVEREFITGLVPFLPTPRIAKRLVNVYRVIKATKSANALEALEREGQFKACLLMLAILFGRPAIAGPFLRALHERRPPFETPTESLIAALRRSVPEAWALGNREEWKKLAATLEAIGVDERVGDCAREAKEVARYSLVSGHDWHTWTTPQASAPAADVPDDARKMQSAVLAP